MLGAIAAVSAAAPEVRVEVTSLPGYGAPPSKMYSGFVDAGTPPSGKGTMYFHYAAFEAEENPATAPVVFWYNGGPGASSLFGLFGELGPLFVDLRSVATADYNKTGVPTPFYNDATWTKRFNVIAVDSPPPVGFSYCTEEGPSGKGTSCGPWNDTAVFKANSKAVTAIMTKAFPEWLKNELYVTGESYAGVYVPGLVADLLAEGTELNIRGYAVGDGCMGMETVCMSLTAPPLTYPSVWEGPYYDIEFFAGHGQVSNELYRKIRKDCPEVDLRKGNLTTLCDGYLKEMVTQIGGFFVYDLYDDCPAGSIKNGMFTALSSRERLSRALKGAVNDYACPGNVLPEYLGRADVRAALGVPADDYFFNADNGAGFTYTMDIADIRYAHRLAVQKGLRVLTYEGDADASGLSSYGLQDVYRKLWPETGMKLTEAWRPWTVDGKARMGGYAMEWDGGKTSHITIRGSGHMVPLNKPDQALTMINAFVFNTGYPKYNA